MSHQQKSQYSVSENIPLSIAQKRIWVMEQLEPDSPFSNRPLAIRLNGILNEATLIQSLSEIIRRHEALRTVFPIQDGQPFQKILPSWTLTPEIIDLGSLPEPHREAEAGKILKRETQKKFDLINGPLIRGVLLRLSDQNHILLLLMHHLVFDGWSESIFLSELRNFYGAFSQTKNNKAISNQNIPLPELPIQYKDFTLWQHKRVNEAFLSDHLNYWQAKLGNALSPLRVPTDYPRPYTRTFQAGSVSTLFPQALVESLTTLSHMEKVTPFMTVLALLQTLLYRYTGQQTINVGVPVAGRNHSETEPLIGLFMNTLVMSSDFINDPTFRQLLTHVKQVTLQAFSHQELPFEKIVEVLHPIRERNTWPLFQVLLNFRNLPQTDSRPTEHLHIEPFSFEWGMIGGLDLSLDIKKCPEGMHCQFSYPVDLFREKTIQSFAKHFRNLLENVIATPDKPVGTLNLLTPEEHHQILIEWNNTHEEYPNACVHELVEKQVNLTPNAVAVVFQEHQLTYEELNQSANQLAHYLTKQGIPPEATIGICVDSSLEMVIGLLGILKAGCAYVPLDPRYPHERLEYMAEDSKISFLLTQGHLKTVLSNHKAGIICLDSDRDLWSRESIQNLQIGCTEDSLAYVMYTSGTTGQPKGVMVTHRGACNHLYWRHDYFGLTPSDLVLQKASLSFDDSVWEIFEPLTSGAQLVIAQSEQNQNVCYLIETVIQQKITALCLVPSLLWLFLEEPNVRRCHTLRRVTTGGEELSVELQEKFFQLLNADLYNGYGPTEATIAVSYWKCKPGGNSPIVPIGKPIRNTQLYVLNPQLQPAPIGVTGEIFIGGNSLARGYLNNPELTGEKFINNPFGQGVLYQTGDLGRHSRDGNLEFIGRIDDQVKIRGIRVELGEIKNSLNQYPQIEKSEIVTTGNSKKDQMVIAYYLSKNRQQISPQILREFLKHKLPDYMIPAAFVYLASIPITPSGKIDRNALPSPQREHYINKEVVQPKTETEKNLTRIWQEALNLSEEISIHDNFFELGGHSLSAFRVVSRIRDIFKVELPLRCLFESPTLAELTKVLDVALSLEQVHK
ncbi:MAG TPA: amino acid adenylation domain-containing protein [Nitrospirales bacterium]|nr:non-ribosomal peptide synthetase [Nitrospiraceae bacterium]HNP31021.1 amino acid adenylation domain-containing protein [Nitrospirales bacterium]